MKKSLLKLAPLLALGAFYPAVAWAATCTGTGLSNLLCTINELLGALLPILVSLGVIYFVWGVVQFVIAGGEEAKTKGRDRMIYGIIGLTVIVSVWGLVELLASTFSVGGVSAPTTDLISTGSTPGAGCEFISGEAKFQDLLSYLTCLINNSVIPFMFAVAIIFFVWGAIKFLIMGADEEKRGNRANSS